MLRSRLTSEPVQGVGVAGIQLASGLILRYFNPAGAQLGGFRMEKSQFLKDFLLLIRPPEGSKLGSFQEK
jgi:UDP-glucose 4-epimerase